MSNFFNTRLEFLRSVGSTQRAQILGKELGLFTYGDLIQRYPFRYLDRTQFYNVADLHDDLSYVQVRGMLRGKELIGEGPKQRLTAKVGDGTGELELVWFKGVKWVQQYTKNNQEYIVFGKPTMFNGRPELPAADVQHVRKAQKLPSHRQQGHYADGG